MIFLFQIKKAPERILKAVNNIDQQQANNILFLWNDTSQARKEPAVLYVFMYGSNKKISTSMNNYQVVPVRWSKRENYTAKLTM